MKLPDIKILDEKNKLLHKKSEEIKFPMDKKDIDLPSFNASEFKIKNNKKNTINSSQ